MKNYKQFMEERYITCKHCGYNNLKKRFSAFGTCLRCNAIIDKKTYFKVRMKQLSIRNPKSRGREGLRSCLYF